MNGPDYQNTPLEEATEDFMKRIHHYEDVHQTIDEEKEKHLSYMKIYNCGNEIIKVQNVCFRYFGNFTNLFF